MYLLRKILQVINGKNIPLLKACILQPLTALPAVYKRSKWIITSLLLGIGFLGMSCTSSTSSENLAQVEAVQPQVANNIAASESKTIPAKYVVTIKDMKYNPAVTQAHLGDTIMFINKDLVPHNVADSLTKEWLSPQLNFGDEWSMVVNKNLHFYCAYHPNMEGDIHVETSLSAQK